MKERETMGAVSSQLRRSLGNYNIERRAEKVLEKMSKTGKAPLSPRHDSEKPYIDEILRNSKLKEVKK